MAISADQFAKTLVSSGLMAADELREFRDSLTANEQAGDIASVSSLLVARGRLTPFQVKQVLGGRGAALVIGEYVLLDLLGAGGMGQVYKARHRRMERIVALKMMSTAAMKDEGAVKRFQREVRAAAKLNHPNVVAAFDAGECRGTHFLVIEYVDGADLSGIVKQQGPLPLDQAIQCVLQAARGLDYAHAQGVIHRDIKPANLLLDKQGVVKVLDMGLARIDDCSKEHLTGTEQVMGTVDYMSPEQAMSTHVVDARSDIYSLGCTLWHLLTARRMYEGETAVQRIMQHTSAAIPALAQARDDVSWPLEQLFRKMVAKRPEQRYQSMAEVVVDLESLQASSSGLSKLALDTSDVQLQSFLGQVGEQTRATMRRPSAHPTAMSPGTLAAGTPTATFQASEFDTDPKSEISIQGQAARGAVAADGGNRPPWRNRKSLVFGGGAASFALLLGVIVLLKNRQGEVIARIEVPTNATVTVQKDGKDVATVDDNPTPSSSVAATVSYGPGSQSDLLTSPQWKWSEPENLGPTVNTSASEGGPAISGDGLQLVFTATRDGGLGANDLWISQRTSVDQPFDAAVNLKSEINSASGDQSPWLSADGTTLLFSSTRQNKGLQLWIAQRAKSTDPFGQASFMNIPGTTETGAILADGLALVFASRRGGGLGEIDIWQCGRSAVGSPFGTPFNLGPNVNTESDDRSPWLSADGRVMLFTVAEMNAIDNSKVSNHVWLVERPTIDAPFGQRRRAGLPSRKLADEVHPSVTADGKLLFFSSTRGRGHGMSDIWFSRRVPVYP